MRWLEGLGIGYGFDALGMRCWWLLLLAKNVNVVQVQREVFTQLSLADSKLGKIIALHQRFI